MNLKLSFSWIGLVIFTLPMLFNIAYAVFPPKGESGQRPAITRWIELVEQISRIAYLFLLTLLVSREPLRPRSVWLWMAVCFLLLYYAVWIRYFAGGRNVELLSRAFLFVPIPLVVFPVAYYLCAAVWMHNTPAAVMMIVFGAAHIAVSMQSFR